MKLRGSTKKVKLKKAYNSITENQKRQVLMRYLRFCKDQHAFEFLNWRKMVMKADLTVNEMIVFRIRVGFLKS